jgi:hypothetical protein
MKSFRRASGVGLVGAAAMLAGLANLPTPAAAATVASSTICDQAFCAGADESLANGDTLGVKVDPAVAIALSMQPAAQMPAAGSEISAAAMIALGVVMMTSRVRRKGLWVLRAPWRSVAGRPG